MKQYLGLSLALILNFYYLSAATIPVGQNQKMKDLSKIQDGNEYVLDYGTYAFPNIVIKKSLIVRSAKSDARATLKFPSQWNKLPNNGPDLGPAKGGTISCYGTCTLKDVKTVGGPEVIVFQSNPKSAVFAEHIDMDGGGIIRGSGGNLVSIKNVQSSGKPTAYFIANFTNPVKQYLVDLSGNTLPVQQGGYCISGKPTCKNKPLPNNQIEDPAAGEAAIRFMQADHVVLKGIVGKAWSHDGVHDWKQFLQLRDSNLIEVFNSNLPIVDIGDMQWRKPPQETKEVRFTDCTLDQVHKTPGWKKIVYKNTKVAGKVLNQTDVK
jgi:hypothetical protein